MTEQSSADAAEASDLFEKALHFPDGLPGLPDLERFVIVELREDGAFQQLQSLDNIDISMIVCVPWLFFPDYAPVLSDVEQAELELETADDAILFVPVTIDSETREIFLNLLGPFVVNVKTRKGRQLVLTGTDYSTRTPIELPGA
ncbi:MAG: flagellar assembly protein FliW [Acidimicrobiia bacterium]|nr:flagellar assembly protein FliW [Acidimicrobiia bacterium]MDJ0664287.1 flagellar assembly protein FliW [Acidimicrobiia bacterium]